MLLSTVVLFLFFVVIFSDNIKAQIASIISEDGDGIVGVTSLMNATINEDVQAVKFFAKSGVVVVNQKNIGGATALHIAARNGNVEIAKILIENGANVNIADNEGWTPIMRAALGKNSELIKIFLNAGADAKKMNSLGETAIIHSTSSECLDCLEQLFSRYNFAENVNVDVLRNQLELAMVIANNKNNTEIQALLREYVGGEMAKSKSYSLINQNNDGSTIEMPVMINKSVDNGIVIVRSLDNKNTGTSYKFNKLTPEKRSVVNNPNKKPIYKFLSKQDQIEPVQSVPVTQQNNQVVTQNNPQKTHEKVAYKTNVSGATINDNNKRFVFGGNKKPYTPFTIANTKSEPENLKKTNDDPRNNLPNIDHKEAVADTKTVLASEPESPSNENKTNMVEKSKYKFLGQKSPPLTIKTKVKTEQPPITNQNSEPEPTKAVYRLKDNPKASAKHSNNSNKVVDDKNPVDIADKTPADNNSSDENKEKKEVRSKYKFLGQAPATSAEDVVPAQKPVE